MNITPAMAAVLNEARQKLEAMAGYPVQLTLQPARFLDGVPVPEAARYVCEALQLECDAVLRKGRKREHVLARQCLVRMYCLYSTCDLKSIGEPMGYKEHTIVIYGRDTVTELINNGDVQATLFYSKTFEALVNKYHPLYANHKA